MTVLLCGLHTSGPLGGGVQEGAVMSYNLQEKKEENLKHFSGKDSGLILRTVTFDCQHSFSLK